MFLHNRGNLKWVKEHPHISVEKKLIWCAEDVESIHFMFKKGYVHHVDLEIQVKSEIIIGQKIRTNFFYWK